MECAGADNECVRDECYEPHMGGPGHDEDHEGEETSGLVSLLCVRL